MLTFIIRRLILLVLVLFGVSVLIFGIMMTFSPERRAAAFVNSPQQAKDLEKLVDSLGLRDPYHVQYLRWLKNITQGNLGWSLIAAAPVSEAFWRYFPVTFEMNMFAAPIVIFVGIWLGTLAGINRDKPVDHATRIFAIIGWSLPTFLFALVLLMVFYGYFKLVTPGVLSHEINMMLLDNPGDFTPLHRALHPGRDPQQPLGRDLGRLSPISSCRSPPTPSWWWP